MITINKRVNATNKKDQSLNYLRLAGQFFCLYLSDRKMLIVFKMVHMMNIRKVLFVEVTNSEEVCGRLRGERARWCVSVSVCLCVSVCVCERERERERDTFCCV